MSVQSVKCTINGTEYTLTLNSSSGKYEATITAPNKSSFNQSGGYYPVTITANDDAGNSTTISSNDTTLGESCRLVVKEKIVPVITITNPTAGAYIINNKPTITWTVTDNDSGVNSGSISIKIDGGSAITSGITKTPTSNGYTCSYTPSAALGDGQHTIVFDAKDNDGNSAVQKSVSFKIDTVAPVLNITSPVDGYRTNNATVTVAGTTNDVTSSPVTVTINDASTTVGSNGSFSKTITLSEGSNTITIVATDSAGKSTTVTRTVTLDTGAPQFVSVTINPNPVDAGNTYVISVSVVDE